MRMMKHLLSASQWIWLSFGLKRSIKSINAAHLRWMDCRWKNVWAECWCSNKSTSLEIPVDDFDFWDEQCLSFIFQWRTRVILLESLTGQNKRFKYGGRDESAKAENKGGLSIEKLLKNKMKFKKKRRLKLSQLQQISNLRDKYVLKV